MSALLNILRPILETYTIDKYRYSKCQLNWFQTQACLKLYVKIFRYSHLQQPSMPGLNFALDWILHIDQGHGGCNICELQRSETPEMTFCAMQKSRPFYCRLPIHGCAYNFINLFNDNFELRRKLDKNQSWVLICRVIICRVKPFQSLTQSFKYSRTCLCTIGRSGYCVCLSKV